MSSSPAQIRLSVSLSGGAALGAFHAGVLGALVTGVQTLLEDDPESVRVDAIGGASAGALGSMFAAHALLHGLDAVELLSQAWVDEVSLDMLREHGPRAPLGFAKLRERLPHDLQVERWTKVDAGPHPTPIGLEVSLTGLRGLRYWLETADDWHIPAVTYADWGEFVLQPGGGVDQLLTPEGGSVLDFVLASAANAAAFAPELLDRTRDREAFAARNIEDLPADARLWYTDGSTISSEPLGRVLALAHTVDPGRDDPGARHVHLLVDPLSEIPADDRAWTADGSRPSWLEGLVRTLEIMPEQVQHDDLQRVQHVNHQFARLDRAVDALAPHIDATAAKALRDVFADELDIADDATPVAVLRRAMARVAGLDDKVPVHLDLISPFLLTDEHDRGVPGLLAGEIMGDFGGFVDRRLRRSDFALGYDCMLKWTPMGLDRADVDERAIDRVVTALERARPMPWPQVEHGHASTSDLSWRSRWELAQLALHTLRVIGTDLWRLVRS